MPPPPSPIGFDASVLINFCAAERLDLLPAVCPPPRYVLQDVLEELEDDDCRAAVESLVNQGEFEVVMVRDPDELDRWRGYTRRLDAGESATLAVAVVRGWSVALDDAAARRVAEADLDPDRLTGTVGLLAAAVEAGLLWETEGDLLLRTMIDAGYWSPVERLKDL